MSARAAKRARPSTRVQRNKPYRRSILIVPPDEDYDVSAFFAEREKDVTYFPQLKPRKRAPKTRRVSPPLQHDPAEQIRILEEFGAAEDFELCVEHIKPDFYLYGGRKRLETSGEGMEFEQKSMTPTVPELSTLRTSVPSFRTSMSAGSPSMIVPSPAIVAASPAVVAASPAMPAFDPTTNTTLSTGRGKSTASTLQATALEASTSTARQPSGISPSEPPVSDVSLPSALFKSRLRSRTGSTLANAVPSTSNEQTSVEMSAASPSTFAGSTAGDQWSRPTLQSTAPESTRSLGLSATQEEPAIETRSMRTAREKSSLLRISTTAASSSVRELTSRQEIEASSRATFLSTDREQSSVLPVQPTASDVSASFAQEKSRDSTLQTSDTAASPSIPVFDLSTASKVSTRRGKSTASTLQTTALEASTSMTREPPSTRESLTSTSREKPEDSTLRTSITAVSSSTLALDSTATTTAREKSSASAVRSVASKLSASTSREATSVSSLHSTAPDVSLPSGLFRSQTRSLEPEIPMETGVPSTSDVHTGISEPTMEFRSAEESAFKSALSTSHNSSFPTAAEASAAIQPSASTAHEKSADPTLQTSVTAAFPSSTLALDSTVASKISTRRGKSTASVLQTTALEASTSTAREPSTSTGHEKSEVSALRTSITAASSSMHTAHSLHQTRPSTSPERTAVPELQQAVLSLSPSMAQFRSEVEKSRFLSTTRAPHTLNATTFGLSTLRDPNLSSLEKLLHVCGQFAEVPFKEFIESEFHANDLLKLGEGTHAEVFQAKTIAGEKVALKIVPFTVDEDDLVTMNGDTMKTCDAITSEAVISHQLSGLTDGIRNNTDGFVRVVRMSVVKGDYPAALLKAWKVFKKTRKKEAFNDCPDTYGSPERLYLAIALTLGGQCLETYTPTNENEAVSIMLQTMLALMVAEKEYEFEHRDLHVGNVLVEKTKAGEICSYCLDGREIAIHAHECRVKIIDFTLSRLNTRDFGIVCLNLDSDEDLFTGDGEGVKGGDYQFDIYRKMRAANGNDWSAFTPVTSVFWMHYLSKKVFSKLKGKKKGERGKQLQRIFDNLLEHETLGDFYFKDAEFQSLLEAYYL